MDAYRHVQRLELAWFEDQSTGGLLAILNDDVNQLERFLDMGAQELIRTLVNIIFVGVVFFVASPVLGGGVPAHPDHRVGLGPLPAAPGALLHRGAGGGRRPGGALANNVSGIATIRSFTAEDRETARVDGASQGYRGPTGGHRCRRPSSR